MRMIPSQPLKTQSHAEKRVFDLLRSAFSGPGQTGWFAMHSLNLPQHASKRFGEIDFVVCGPEGLFVLEVKGGGVSFHGGNQWETKNRQGEVYRLKESPFKQAEGALHGLRTKLPTPLIQGLVVGYGVVVPDVDQFPESAEWDRGMFADARDCRQFEHWLTRFIKYWRAKDPRKSVVPLEQLSRLQQYLRPEFEAVVPLHVSVHEVETRIARLTEDQLRLIDVVEANSRVVCIGGAGTGKTMLALELAKRWNAAGMNVALACQSLWLKGFLEQSAAVPGLTVTLAESISLAARRAGIEKFDALVVDEGQDLLDMEPLSRLDGSLHGGLSQGRWCFFHDANNQSGLCGRYVPDAYDYLESFGPVKVPLKTNCRNTSPILDRIRMSLKADLGTASVGDGPAVREVHAADAQGAMQALEKELRDLMDKDGFSPGDILVLSHLPFAQSCAAALPAGLRKSLSILDDASPRNMHRTAIGYAEIRNFKGLESEVVVLVDLPRPGQSEALRSQHYVGMSRARALLSLIAC